MLCFEKVRFVGNDPCVVPKSSNAKREAVKQRKLKRFAPTEQKNSIIPLSQVLGFLGASPKEAPKRGLGQNPKVFTS